MKVIQVMPNFSLAGAEIMCENLVYSLMNLGVDVLVVSLYTQHSAITDRMESAGVKVLYLDKKRGLDLSMIGKLVRLFKQEKPDVVHTHRYSMQYAVPAAVKAGVKRLVHTVHNVADKELSKSKRFVAKIFYKRYGVIPVALSNLVKDSIVKEYRLAPEQIPVVFNGIDLSKCVKKEKYELGEKFKLLHIGRFEPQKNHAMLIKAFAKFHNEHPNSLLQLIGDGEGRKAAEELVKELEIVDYVEFLGIQSNVHGFLHNADVFVLPSLYEGIPITLIEAMGTGLPIIATRVGGIPDMLTHNESAILVDVDEDQAICAIFQLYNNAALRKSLGQNAVNASTVFSSVKMVNDYFNVYERKW